MKPPAGPFTPGEVVRCEVALANDRGAATDPTVLTFEYTYLDKRGETHGPYAFVYGTDDEVVRLSKGSFYFDLPTLSMVLGGEIHRRWEATGAVATADERVILVAPSIVLPPPAE